MWKQTAVLLMENISLCRGLLSEAQKKEQCLLENRLGDCVAIFLEEERLTSKLVNAQARQETLLLEMQRQCGAARECSFANLIDFMPSIDRARIAGLIEELAVLMPCLKQYTENNRILMDRAKRFADFNINVLTQAAANDIYAPQGGEGAVVQGKKMFDQSV